MENLDKIARADSLLFEPTRIHEEEKVKLVWKLWSLGEGSVG